MPNPNTATPKCLPLLLGRQVTLDAALRSVDDMLLELSYPSKQAALYSHLREQQPAIEALVSFHLGLSTAERCRVSETREWMCGYYNSLYFTTPENVPCHSRLLWNLRRRILSFLGYPVPCRYISRRYAETLLKSGYLIMEYIEGPGPITTVRTLGGPGSTARQATEWKFLPRSIPHHTQFGSRPLPRIGSLVLDQHGTVQLSNRPSNFRLQQLENKSVPTDIDRDTTYESTEVYYCSLLACHDNRIFHQANSILSPSDGQAQLAVLAAMRALLPNYATRHFRDGPFFFNLTDVHPNNVFVDADWRIKCLIDLEWACVRPVEMLSAPVWVTGKCVDQLPPGEDLDPYHVILEEFFDAFDREQGSLSPLQNRDVSLTTDMMRRGFETGHFWFYHALDNPKVACNLFFQHILRMFAGAISENSMAGFNGYSAPFWKKDSKEIIK